MGKGGYLGGSTIVGAHGSGWVGSGSVTSQPASNRKRTPRSKKVPKGDRFQQSSRKGNGLTIAEQVARANQRVDRLQADIAKAKQRVLALEGQLVEAKRQLDAAKALPRRSEAGRAASRNDP